MKLNHHGFEVGSDRKPYSSVNVAIWIGVCVTAMATGLGLSSIIVLAVRWALS